MNWIVDTNHKILFTGSPSECEIFIKKFGHKVIHTAKDVIWVN